MKHALITTAFLGLLLAVPTPAKAQWNQLIKQIFRSSSPSNKEASQGGLTADEAERQCRQHASYKLNSFSAKQAYEHCLTVIYDQYREAEKARLIRDQKRQQSERDKEKLTARMNEVCRQGFQGEAAEMFREYEHREDWYLSEFEHFLAYVKRLGLYNQYDRYRDLELTYPKHIRDKFPGVLWLENFMKRDQDLANRFSKNVGTIGTWRVERPNYGDTRSRYDLSSFYLKSCDLKAYSIH